MSMESGSAEMAREAAGSPWRIVQPKSMGPLKRLFGSLGVDGDGTEFEIEHVDPFVMCDFVCFPIDLQGPPFRPPFCAHPHSGVAVASILIEGEDISAWDNIRGFEAEKLSAGGVYVVCTGQGCVHDEGPDAVVVERVLRRTPFGLVGEDRPGQRLCMFQLWFDPGHVHADAGPPSVSSQVVQPTSVPMITAGAMKARVLVGTYDGVSVVDMPVTCLHCALLPFVGHGVVKIPAGSSGFLFAVEREAHVVIAEQDFVVPHQTELLLPPQPEAYELKVDVHVKAEGPEKDAMADEALQILICFGPPIGKPFYKLLGYGGALVASSEERVRSLMLQYEQDPMNFGRPLGMDAPDTSRYGLQGGYKNPLDGKGECQRTDAAAMAPEARFYLLEKGPYQPKGTGKGH